MTDQQPSLRFTMQEPEMLGRCVLLLDDHSPTQFTVASALTDAGADVRFAGNTLEAIFRCASRLETSRPFDLVIVALGDALGPDACRQLRENGYHGPILALSDGGDASNVLDAGADAMLPRRSDGLALYESAVRLIDGPNDAEVRRDPSDHPPVLSDLSAFPQMHTMLERFVDQLPQQLSAMADAAAQRDLDHLENLVGELKRSAGSHGFIDISREAAETERHLRVTDQLQQALDPLAEVCRRAAVRSDESLPLPPSA